MSAVKPTRLIDDPFLYPAEVNAPYRISLSVHPAMLPRMAEASNPSEGRAAFIRMVMNHVTKLASSQRVLDLCRKPWPDVIDKPGTRHCTSLAGILTCQCVVKLDDMVQASLDNQGNYRFRTPAQLTRYCLENVLFNPSDRAKMRTVGERIKAPKKELTKILLALNPGVIERMDKRCEYLGITRSRYLRLMIDDALEGTNKLLTLLNSLPDHLRRNPQNMLAGAERDPKDFLN